MDTEKVVYVGGMKIPYRLYIDDLLSMSESASGPWWRHQMKTFSALLAICAGNSLVPGEFPAQ